MSELGQFWAQVREVWDQGAFGVEADRIIVAIVVFMAFVVLRGLVSGFLLNMLERLVGRSSNRFDDELVVALSGPIRFVFLVVGLFLASRVAPLPDEIDAAMAKVVRSLIAFTIFWTFYRCVGPLSFVLDRAITSVGGEGMASTLKNFAVRLIRVIITVLGAAAILQEWDFNIGAVLGGLGLIGMAVAFGAQNLISNLFGGVAIFVDKIFVEGEWIKTTDVEGTVETVGFRTTKIRRFDKALVTVPNSDLADNAVTNFSRMTNRRIYWMVGLEYRTTNDQLKQVVDGLNDYIRGNDDFETDPAKVSTLIHADSFNSSSIDIMLYCFTTTTKWAEWMKVKEELLYHLKTLVEDAGTSFAFPSSSIYVETMPFGTPESVPARNEDGSQRMPASDRGPVVEKE
ncbi:MULTISPECIES: mechanosensitive ion channel family protein [unclassified Minwuia]|jgi:MscS family membrane protein|uniref:mechanosensitive ion channel family protein n=1 Tax=unclassified Minwuia TaxID=2618799 RepID=UPI002479DE73|nr:MULTISPECIES: mechanosensitive ion channel family protein [unclassified Minwuia]